jgi:hypothetical protein
MLAMLQLLSGKVKDFKAIGFSEGTGYCLAHSHSHISLPRTGERVSLCNDLFEACSAFTRVTACTLAGSPKVFRYIEGFSFFVTSITAPIASGWSEIAGWDSHPLRNAALSRRTPKAVISQTKKNYPGRWPILCLQTVRSRILQYIFY